MQNLVAGSVLVVLRNPQGVVRMILKDVTLNLHFSLECDWIHCEYKPRKNTSFAISISKTILATTP